MKLLLGLLCCSVYADQITGLQVTPGLQMTVAYALMVQADQKVVCTVSMDFKTVQVKDKEFCLRVVNEEIDKAVVGGDEGLVHLLFRSRSLIEKAKL